MSDQLSTSGGRQWQFADPMPVGSSRSRVHMIANGAEGHHRINLSVKVGRGGVQTLAAG